MGLTLEGFVSRLRDAKPVHCVYCSAGLEGLISAWRLEDQYIVTWEECRTGDQYNENAYTRDERMEFATPEAVVEFLEQSGHSATQFHP